MKCTTQGVVVVVFLDGGKGRSHPQSLPITNIGDVSAEPTFRDQTPLFGVQSDCSLGESQTGVVPSILC